MEKQKMKTAIAVAAAALLGAALVLAGCESPVFDEGQTSGSGAGVVGLSNSALRTISLSLSPGAIGVNVITATWAAVAGATAYEVYCDPTNTPSTLVYSGTALSTTITGLSAGTTYYVQVKALDSTNAIIDQTGIESCHTSDSLTGAYFAQFTPYMSIGGDYYMFDETEGYHFAYNMSDYTSYVGYDVLGDIRYIHHFGNNVPITITEIDGTTTHNFTGAAGVMIIELYNDGNDDNWGYTGTGNFIASYYYGGVIDGNTGVYTSVNMGIAATNNGNPNSPYLTPRFVTLDDAITASDGVVKLEVYIKEPAEYYGM
jgi:hypothetical protein